MTEKEKSFIYENFNSKGAEWCAMKLKKKLACIHVHVSNQRRLILEGKSDEIYARYVAPRTTKADYTVSHTVKED